MSGLPVSSLTEQLRRTLGDKILSCTERLGEVTLEVADTDWKPVAQQLRDELAFEQMIDLCGVDYQDYAGWTGRRFAVVCHLLSLSGNYRVRVRSFARDDDFPVFSSLTDIWPAANWYEREAFDLFGLVFEGHVDLRRILTDYGFVGHPFRKDFPMHGHVEMRYDPEQRRVIYQPVSVDLRNNVPRVVRDEGFHRG